MATYWVYGIIGVGIVAISLGLWVGVSTLKSQQFISKEGAINIVKTQYFADRPHVPLNAELLLFLKYNGTVNGDLQFIEYKVDPTSHTVTEELGSTAFGKSQEYLAKEIDRFVWVVSFGSPKPSSYWVDANTGEVIRFLDCRVCG